MFILLFPMEMGIMAGLFGIRQIMQAVSEQRSTRRIQRWMQGGRTEEKWKEEKFGLAPIMPLLKRGMIIGMPVGVVMDMIAYAAAEPLVKISQKAGGAAGVLACQNGSTPLRVALSLWGHGSLPAGVIAFVGLAVGTATAVCGVIVKRKVFGRAGQGVYRL